tara:strand:- start:2694 stop:3494 length:801 start_codon:yes stop_codon:yes gene_type:complete
MAINQGSILDHIDKPAIHPDDAIYQSLTPTSDGQVAVTVNGVSTTANVHPYGFISAAGHASNYLTLADGVKSGQCVTIQESGGTVGTNLIIKNSSASTLATIPAGGTFMFKWYFTSTSAGAWKVIGSTDEDITDSSSSWSTTPSAGVTGTCKANYLGGDLIRLEVTVSGLGDTENVVINTPVAFRVADVMVWTSTAQTSRTITIENTAGTAVTDAIDGATNHKLARATTIDDAQDAFAVGDNDLVVAADAGSGDWAGVVYIDIVQS